ncbi:L-lysine 6-transaminase [Salsipaludibacter albus]|uniref:L-lysine 6-transaminase n=1 Tax=Salsipaludibacter albus TaxID=2849650 RepID=UPI001EE4B621|nr:L-lysine 6-transaminase [Salsipaludibacter albus]MBY5161623.1 L-lysine 6-transaminase [Salsipaludibacter albus]
MTRGAPADVLDTLRGHLLVDGFDLVLDLDRSSGAHLVDQRDGRSWLDMFSFFASNALGMNHPVFADDDVRERLLRAAINKPSNSDVYSDVLADFVTSFERVLGIDELPHLFLIEGGALAVENTLKAAFDHHSRRSEAAGRGDGPGVIAHLQGAFHGRSGYTMSLTNTDPAKVARFPKFDWPRLPTPALSFPLEANADANEAATVAALAAVTELFEQRGHDIAAFIAEPIQGEGGDRHLSATYLQGVQELCHAHDSLFILDEVQTGVGITGSPWVHTQLGLEPDLVAFGKKTHVCGVMGGRHVDDLDDNVFTVSSRINSTFGGNLTDIARATTIFDVIERDSLVDNAAKVGEHLLIGLRELADDHPSVSNARGRGLFCAFDLPDRDRRDAVVSHLYAHERVIVLGCGTRSIRFRPALTITPAEIDLALDAVQRALVATA